MCEKNENTIPSQETAESWEMTEEKPEAAAEAAEETTEAAVEKPEAAAETAEEKAEAAEAATEETTEAVIEKPEAVAEMMEEKAETAAETAEEKPEAAPRVDLNIPNISISGSRRIPEAPEYPGKAEKTVRKKRKSGGYFRKALLAVSLGLFFGLFAGLGFYAAVHVMEKAPSEDVYAENDTRELEEMVEKLLEEQKQPQWTEGDVEVTRVITSDVSEIVEKVIPAMVSIVSNYRSEGTTFFGESYSEIVPSSASGFILGESDTELLIATNYHVVEDTVELWVTFIDGEEAEAQVKGTDSEMDLAVIAVPLEELSDSTRAAITFVKLGNSDNLRMGEQVIALGNALGYGQSMTGGYISAPEREVTTEDGSTGIFIQTDAAINPGNSGGALLNMEGEVIGINSSKIGDIRIEGIGFAIPISAAEPIISDLMLQETRTRVKESERGYIGIYMEEVDGQFARLYGVPDGVFVTEVAADSPAEEVGILSGDVLVEFDGEEITSIQQLQNKLEYYKIGQTVSVVVKRLQNGVYEDVTFTITLGRRTE